LNADAIILNVLGLFGESTLVANELAD
jgi:hypothetical protein